MSNEWYREGRVSVPSGSRNVDGSGTGWLTSGVKAGDVLVLNGAPLEIASVESDDRLILAEEYSGETVAGGKYAIIQRARSTALADIALDLKKAIAKLEEKTSLPATLGLYIDRDGDVAQLDVGEPSEQTPADPGTGTEETSGEGEGD